jgi:uncharacterized protein (DUF488 family)
MRILDTTVRFGATYDELTRCGGILVVRRGLTIATLGYQMRTLADLVAQLVEHGVDVLVDVRETAWSHRREFSKSWLQKAVEDVGITYFHASFAGNPKALRSAGTTHAEKLEHYRTYVREEPEVLSLFQTLVDELQEHHLTACLFCYERHPDDCHRSVLIQEWIEAASAKVNVVHLGPGGAPRLVTNQG